MTTTNHMLSTKLVCHAAMLCAMSLPIKSLAAEGDMHTRMLASSCMTCHGSHSSSNSVIPGLTGLDDVYFIQKMHDFQHSGNEHDVMVQHSKGLTESEIQKLAAFFAQQPKDCPNIKKRPIEDQEK